MPQRLVFNSDHDLLQPSLPARTILNEELVSKAEEIPNQGDTRVQDRPVCLQANAGRGLHGECQTPTFESACSGQDLAFLARILFII